MCTNIAKAKKDHGEQKYAQAIFRDSNLRGAWCVCRRAGAISWRAWCVRRGAWCVRRSATKKPNEAAAPAAKKGRSKAAAAHDRRVGIHAANDVREEGGLQRSGVHQKVPRDLSVQAEWLWEDVGPRLLCVHQHPASCNVHPALQQAAKAPQSSKAKQAEGKLGTLRMISIFSPHLA